ncbi:MAG: hypothetical protein ACK4P3_06475 [Fimbriimonadaceae bacterium]
MAVILYSSMQSSVDAAVNAARAGYWLMRQLMPLALDIVGIDDHV